MRVQLNENWVVRPTQNGLELMAPEHNIILRLSNLALRDEFTAILVGDVEIPTNNEDVEKALKQLESVGAVSKQEGSVRYGTVLTKGEEVVWRIRRNLVGPSGPVTSVYWLDPKQSRFPLAQTHLFTAKYQERTGHGEEVEDAWASGSDTDWELAEFKAIMEALERHASGVIPQSELVKTSAKKLGRRAIDPRNVVAYVAAQYRDGFPFYPFSEEREYWWKPVSMLPGGEEKYLPVECLYYPVGHELILTPYTFASSSGVAAGMSFEDAVLRGLYEAVERDAFMLVWLNRISVPRIDTKTLPSEYHDRILSLEALGYRMHFVDITLDLFPVVLAIGVSETVRPALVLGAAAGTRLEEIVGKALSEVEQQLFWKWRNPDDIRSISDQKDVSEIRDHMALYASPKHLSKAAFLWGGDVWPLQQLSSLDGDVSSVIYALLQRRIETVAIDLTPPNLKKAGVWVVRVIPLGLVPISFGYGMEPLGMERYKRMASQGNPWPEMLPFTHPFA